MSIVDNKYILVKRRRDVSNISVTSLSCKHRPLVRPSDRVRLKNANYAIFSGQIVRLERPIMR